MLTEITVEQAKELMPSVSELISETERYAVSDVNGMIFQLIEGSWCFTGFRCRY